MCGICGIINRSDRATSVSKEDLQNMTDIIKHRGPDGGDIIINEGVGIGHRRLSIIDLTDTGKQPMSNNGNNVIIAFNGEIYNHHEIRAELLNLGYTYKGTSDTESILYGYEQWGLGILKKLNGIFSIVIYDKSNHKVYLSRDRFGVKPLYYFTSDDKVIFGSEIKSILKSGVSSELNLESIHEFLYYGYALKEKTLFAGIKKLIPGHVMNIDIDSGVVSFDKFWSHEEMLPENIDINEKDAIIQTRELLEKAVARQLVSDVPVGVFLSGGIDSSAVTAFASKHYKGRLKSYSAGFDFNGGHDELPMANKIAKQYGTDHSELMIKGGDLSSIIEKMVYHHDEPFSDAANIPLFLLTQKVKNECKVILQGDGGDEMFAGYPRYNLLKRYGFYHGISKIKGIISPFVFNDHLKEKLNRFSLVFNEKDEGKMFGKFLTMESEERSPLQVLSSRFRSVIPTVHPFGYYKELSERFKELNGLPQKMLWIDSLIILPDQFLEKVDKSTMASGVEVRVPFLDNNLASFAMKLPGRLKVKKGIKKYILKKALDGIVPNEVLHGPKLGFGVPYQNWLRGPLFDYLYERLHSPYIQKLGIFNFKYINQLLEEHKAQRVDNGFILWKLLNLCIWLEEYNVDITK